MQLTSAFLGSRLSLKHAPVVQVSKDAPRQVTCMAKKKGVRCIVTLECTEARGEGATPSRYTTQKVKSTSLRMYRHSSQPRYPHTYAVAAESQEYHRSHGVEEVQQVSEKAYNAQGNQVDAAQQATDMSASCIRLAKTLSTNAPKPPCEATVPCCSEPCTVAHFPFW